MKQLRSELNGISKIELFFEGMARRLGNVKICTAEEAGIMYGEDEPTQDDNFDPNKDRKWLPRMQRFNNPSSHYKHSEARRQRAIAKQRKRK